MTHKTISAGRIYTLVPGNGVVIDVILIRMIQIYSNVVPADIAVLDCIVTGIKVYSRITRLHPRAASKEPV